MFDESVFEKFVRDAHSALLLTLHNHDPYPAARRQLFIVACYIREVTLGNAFEG